MATAVVARLSAVRAHLNADKLRLASVLGNQVVVGLEQQEGDLGLFIPTDMQLSHEMCINNALYNASARKELNLAASSHGYLDTKRRIRAQSFRGEKSNGLWMPLESLLWTGADPSVLKEGDTLTEFGGYGICQKYFTPATLRALVGNTRQRREVKTFPKHDDTKQFRFIAEDIPEDSIVWLTEKLHGTSARYGHVWDELPLPVWKQLLNRGLRYAHLPSLFADNGWRYLNGSKNVVLERADQRNSWYGTDEFRYALTRGIELRKGEILYFEIVGWASEQTPIMPAHDVTKTGLKQIQQEYGDTIEYTYGCPRGTSRMYVYKILNTDPDGNARELTWHELVRRCGELGLAHVPVVGGPFIHTDTEYTRSVVERFTEGVSLLNPRQIREGVVVRIEGPQGIAHVKNKGFVFKVLEGIVKETDAYVDPEDVA